MMEPDYDYGIRLVFPDLTKMKNNCGLFLPNCPAVYDACMASFEEIPKHHNRGRPDERPYINALIAYRLEKGI